MHRPVPVCALTAVIAFAFLSVPGCSRAEPPAARAAERPGPVAAPIAPEDGGRLELQARAGDPQSFHAEASYKRKGKGDAVTRELEVEVKQAEPGKTWAVTVDGISAGRLVVDASGKGKLDLVASGGKPLAAALPEPKPGSVVRIGDVFELRLENLVAVVDLSVAVTSADQLSGKVTFKVEQVGNEVSREFRVKLAGAPANAVLPVLLAGVPVGDIEVDPNGGGRMKYSSSEPPPFPASFPELGAGSTVRIGDLFTGELVDNRARRQKE